MRKSPLSMPGGSRSQHTSNWRSCVDTRRTNIFYNWRDRKSGNVNFIPLNNSTPDERRYFGNRYGSGVAQNHRFHFANTEPHFDNLYSPYKDTGMQFHGQNKSMEEDDHRQVHISKYVNMDSFLEDPWAELMCRLDDPKTPSKMNISNRCSSIPDFKETRESVSSIDTHFQNIQDNPEFKSQCIVDLEVSDNTSKSNMEESSCTEQGDIKLDMLLNDKSLCNVSNDNYQATNKDDKKDI